VTDKGNLPFQQGRSWRDDLPIHPAAELFPRMTAEELKTTGADIVKNGLTSPIVLWRANPKSPKQLLDGRNRLDAIELVTGLPVRFEQDGSFGTEDKKFHASPCYARILDHRVDPWAYVTSANILRRHLTAEQRQHALIALIARTPEKSDRQLGKEIGVDHKTIASARAKGETTGEISPVEKRVGKDGKARKQPAKKSRREVYSKAPADASTITTFEVAAELKDLVAAKAPGWTGAIVGTQAEVDAAEGRFRDDGAPGHWLIVAPRERVVVDHRVIQWLLLTAPAPPVVVHIDWAFSLAGAGNKARCPVWVSERLTGKSHPQRAGMNWPRELPIPREMPRDDIGADSRAEAERLRVRVEELQAEVRLRDIKIAGLESEIEGKLATGTGGDMSISEFQTAIKKWEDTVETQKNIIRDLQNENAKLRAGVAAPPADDGLNIPRLSASR
jgi:hypothetical protein